MGTLNNQEPRNFMHIVKEDIQRFVEQCDDIAEETGCSITDVIQCAKVLELRRKTSAYIQNGDAFDEQISGFAKLLCETLDRATDRLGTGNAALENLAAMVKEGCDNVANAISNQTFFNDNE